MHIRKHMLSLLILVSDVLSVAEPKLKNKFSVELRYLKFIFSLERKKIVLTF